MMIDIIIHIKYRYTLGNYMMIVNYNTHKYRYTLGNYMMIVNYNTHKSIDTHWGIA